MESVAAKLGAHLKYLLLAFACTLVLAPARSQTYRTMPWEEYNKVQYRQPYLLNIYTSHGALLYFGVKHSYDPCDEQFPEIEYFWRRLDPDVVFYEGPEIPDLRILEQGDPKSEAIREYGERGLVKYLAGSTIPAFSMEPEFGKEVAELLRQYQPEEVKLFYIVRDLAAYDGLNSPKINKEEFLQDAIARYSAEPTLKNVRPRNVAEMQPTFAERFPKLLTYENATMSWVDPAHLASRMNEIARASTEFRDQVIVAKITGAVCDGKRVLAVVGWSHVAREEPAIRTVITENCAH